ncbi:transketolase family protein [Mangrovibrevibacter kandeliae]|uniref:transketolase family protein n=1 Tax=Mangrovibrevibacter kandeliae TaxID=2968473 RepID=UPI00211803CF|nr:transketolase C-terminal domain-containing protein [Aurantimonas sp. CSK15Z-1]MCQ8782818.1 transketolase [Aurantimonas sp. CSK15Z-1]
MRKTCLDMVYELAKTDPRVVFIGSDLSPGLLDEMKQEFPDRHYMEGVMEQHIIGMAAGMAMDGHMPYVNTIATFITRRCYEQVAMDLCLHHLPVRLIANGGGVVYAPLGPTHLAVEDFAIMRALPNMTVTAVSDAEEMKRLMRATLDWPHPIYIRLGKGGDPVVSDERHGFAIGKGIVLKPSEASDPILLISCGVMTARALEAAEALEREGHAVEVVHIHTIKPLDEALVLERAGRARAVFVIEEHTVIGGLGSAVIDLMCEKGGARLPPMRKLGLRDAFAKLYGSQDDILADNGLSPDGIAASIRETLDSFPA